MQWPEASRGVFAISVAAELAGVHPQTLRVYEREGLIQPARSDGGTRRYSRDDVDRLRLIAALTASGVNIPGVKRVLALESQLAALKEKVERLTEELARTHRPPKGRGAGR